MLGLYFAGLKDASLSLAYQGRRDAGFYGRTIPKSRRY